MLNEALGGARPLDSAVFDLQDKLLTHFSLSLSSYPLFQAQASICSSVLSMIL
jgi:hypothetical protein